MADKTYWQQIKEWFSDDNGVPANAVSGEKKKLDQADSNKGLFKTLGWVYVTSVLIWFLINLGRTYTQNYTFPVEVETIPQDKALIEPLREEANVWVSGEGWMMSRLELNPPKIYVNIEENETDGAYVANVQDAVRNEMVNYPNVELVRVNPREIRLDVDDKIEKQIPVVANVDMSLVGQYGMVGDAELSHDSITVIGAASKLSSINFWPTRDVELTDVDGPVNIKLELMPPGEMVKLSRNTVNYKAQVEEFTESEVRVYVRTQGLPEGKEVKYDPSVITIKYDVPLSEYVESQQIVPYKAYVPYNEISNDTTGLVTPVIENTAREMHLRVRSYQPRRIAYYMVVDETEN